MTPNTAGAEVLQQLLDEREITAVALRYCRTIDTKDWSGLAHVFTPDATALLGSPPLLEGLEAISARIEAALGPLDDSQHLVGNHEVLVDGDQATHRCYLHAEHIRRNDHGSPNYIVAGRYQDDLVRTPEGWRISHRTLSVMWTEGNLAVVRPPA